jgi:LysR family hydrogen peroxide-inducible transcriptional activator
MPDAPHPFTLRQLQYVTAVADTGSFRRAAERCAVSQPALSAQIAAVEQGVGVRLFERDHRRVMPTAAGQDLLVRARRLLVAADDLTEAARRLSDPLAGTVRIGVIPTVSPYLLPEVVPALRRRNPRLTVRWIEDKTDVLAARLQEGALDGALLALEPRLADFESQIIGEDPFLLATPRTHPLGARRSPAHLQDLKGAHVLLLDDGHCLRDQALEVCAKGEAEELGFRATSLATLVQMVASGAGVTLLPRLAAPAETRRSNLALRSFAAPSPHRTLALIWRRNTAVQPALRAIAATVRDAYRDAEPRFARSVKPAA